MSINFLFISFFHRFISCSLSNIHECLLSLIVNNSVCADTLDVCIFRNGPLEYI